MSNTQLSPNIKAVENADGARYVLHTSKYQMSTLALHLATAVTAPLAAAAWATWFLWQHARQAEVLLAGLSGLFVAQMLFAALLPAKLLRQRLWQQLMARFGHGEIELRGDRLYLRNCVGVLRPVSQRPIGDFRRIVVYVYQSASAASPEDESTAADRTPSEQTEHAVLAIETGANSPWLLVDGFSKSESLALAEDLHRRLAVAAERFSLPRLAPPPAVIETQESVLYPPLAADFYQRKKPWWLAMHLAGAVGLGALTAIAVDAGAWQASSIKTAIILGWLLEFLILGITLSLPNDSSVP
jgi:hypothetical protein